MKKILSMAAIALIMAGCSNDDENVVINNGEVANAVPVLINQKVAGVESKAAIIPGNEMKAVIVMVDGKDNSATSPDFVSFTPKTDNTLTESDGKNVLANDAARANVANTQFTATTSGKEITLNPTLYYPVDGDDSPKNTWILGVAPQGTVSGTTVTFAETDGLQDVMFAKQQAAGTSKSPNATTLEFEHQTTQLTFVAKLSKELTGTEWDGQVVSVVSITVQGAQVPAALSFKDGIIDWKDGTRLTVAGCNTALKLTPCAPSRPIMVKASTDILVDIELSIGGTRKSYTDLFITDSNGNHLSTETAKSHEVTFTITPPTQAEGAVKINTSAKVVDWVPGEPGQVTIK